MEQPKFVGIYLRVSTKDQNHKSKEHELKSYCHSRGWKNIKVFKDVMSGAKAQRHGLNALLIEVRNNRVSKVVVYKIDRLGRSLTNIVR